MATWETPLFTDTSTTSAKSIQQFGDEFFRYLVYNLVTYAGWTALATYIGSGSATLITVAYDDATHNPFRNGAQRSSTAGQPRSWILLKSPDTLVSYYKNGELKTKPVYMLLEANANDASLRPKTKILFSYHLPDINYPSPQDYSDDILSTSETPFWNLNSYWGYDPDETNRTIHTFCSHSFNEKATFKCLANTTNNTTKAAVVFNYADNGAFWCVFTSSYLVLTSNSKFPPPTPKYALFAIPIENPSPFDQSPLVTFSGYVGEEDNGIPNNAMVIRGFDAIATTTRASTDFFGYASNIIDRPSVGSALRGLDPDGITPSNFAIPCPMFFEFTSDSAIATINEYSPLNNSYMSGTSPNYPEATDSTQSPAVTHISVDSMAFPALVVSGKRGTISYRGNLQDTYLCKAQLTTNNAVDSGSYLVSAAAYYGGTIMEISSVNQSSLSYTSGFKNANGLPINPLGGSVKVPYYIGNILLPAT